MFFRFVGILGSEGAEIFESMQQQISDTLISLTQNLGPPKYFQGSEVGGVHQTGIFSMSSTNSQSHSPENEPAKIVAGRQVKSLLKWAKV